MDLFPKEILDNSAEVHKYKHTVRSKIIYAIILGAVFLFFILLPIIKVDVYRSAPGMIKPNKERLPIGIINSGRILYSSIETNKTVEQGDTLLILDNKVIDEKIELSSNQIDEVEEYIEDLNYLTTNNRIRVKELTSPKYQKEYLEYQQQLHELQTRFSQNKRTLERNKALFEKGVISEVEFEKIKLDYDLAVNKIGQVQQKQQSMWQADLTAAQNNLEQLESGENQLIENKSQSVITAPVSGTLLNTVQLEMGSFVNPGTTIAQISPDTHLIAECYVSPSDIGLLNKKNKVTFQVDAYNYNQWGLLHGKILEMGNDIEMQNGKPVFKIRCMLDKNHLSLKNGVEGKLKKGMTLNAQFILTERSLYNLLYDEVDDWLNPSRA